MTHSHHTDPRLVRPVASGRVVDDRNVRSTSPAAELPVDTPTDATAGMVDRP